MKYEIQCTATGQNTNWHSFASANEYIVANTIMETYIDRNADFDYRILNTQTGEHTL